MAETVSTATGERILRERRIAAGLKVSPLEHHAIRCEADRRGQSMSALIREALRRDGLPLHAG